MQSEIINILPDQENYEIGFADLKDLIKDRYPYRYAVVIGKKLTWEVIDGIKEGPTPVYYDLYHSTNDELNLITAKICRFLCSSGARVTRADPTPSCIDLMEAAEKSI